MAFSIIARGRLGHHGLLSTLLWPHTTFRHPIVLRYCLLSSTLSRSLAMTDLTFLPAGVFSDLSALETLDVDETPGSDTCTPALFASGCSMQNVIPSAAPASSQHFCVCGEGAAPSSAPSPTATASASASTAPRFPINDCSDADPDVSALFCKQDCTPVLRWCLYGRTIDQVCRPLYATQSFTHSFHLSGHLGLVSHLPDHLMMSPHRNRAVLH